MMMEMSCYHGNNVMLPWQQCHVIMTTCFLMSCYHGNMLTNVMLTCVLMSCYHGDMITHKFFEAIRYRELISVICSFEGNEVLFAHLKGMRFIPRSQRRRVFA